MKQLDTREKLWKLESEALEKSREVNNPYWVMCYKNLAMAIDTLDAFMARSSEGINDLLIKENKNNANPKYKIGEVVFVKSELDDEKICQDVIKSANTTIDGRTCFYETYIPHMPSDTKGETIYSYEEDTGDAKKRFIN